MTKIKKILSTVERWMQKPGFKKDFDKEYREFLLSELAHKEWR